MRSLRRKNAANSVAVVAAGLCLGVALMPGRAAAEEVSTKDQLLELTGGYRVKVVWNQGAENDKQLMFFDTDVGEVQALPVPGGSAPVISRDGRRVFVSAGKAPDERRVIMFDTETGDSKEFPAGPGNNLLEVWYDAEAGREWVYVNSTGDFGEAWNQPRGGAIHRFPTDDPEARELFWNRTSSHIWLFLSADGTRGCFEPSWGNIGQMKVAFTEDGQVDPGKSSYQQFGGGCFPSIAPDNSYRIFRLDGDHHSITMHDADNSASRKIAVSDMPGVRENNRNTWLTRWSTHPRYLTLVAPAGGDAKIRIGRFDEEFTAVEQWVQVSLPDGPQCWQSHAWVATEMPAAERSGLFRRRR